MYTSVQDECFEFQERHYEKQLARGFSEDDIQDYPTGELLQAMKKWRENNL